MLTWTEGMAAMASFSWSRKGEKKASDWKASERALFPTLSCLTTKGRSIWGCSIRVFIAMFKYNCGQPWVVCGPGGRSHPQVDTRAALMSAFCPELWAWFLASFKDAGHRSWLTWAPVWLKELEPCGWKPRGCLTRDQKWP